MKTIYKFIFAITAVAALFTSCNKEVKYAETISVSPSTEIAFDGEAPVNVDIQITADGDWYIYAPSWIKATPSHGSGNTKVTLAAAKNVDDYNELSAPRSGEVDVCGQTKYTSVPVSQNGEKGLDATKYMTKITKAEEFTAGYNYLITATVNGTINACMPCAAGVDDNSYAYMFPTTVKANDEGVIVQDNGNLCFKLEASDEEGKYVIKQPNGSYIYQSSSYANFYNTADKAKASVWSLSFDASGNAVLTNTSAGDRILQYDYNTYKDFGAWSGDIQSGYMLPVLYKDMAKPSDEVISAPSNTYALASATEVSIAITSNKTWKVRCHESWVKSIVPTSGEGNGSIVITMEPNTGTEARDAAIQIIGESTNFYIALTQAAPITTMAGLAAWANIGGTTYEMDCKDVKVSYVNGNNAYLEDETGGILLYMKSHGLTAGNVINGKISGNITLYNKLPELTTIVATSATVTTGEVPCTTVTLADLNKNFSRYLSCRVKLEGVTVTTGVAKRKDKGTLTQGEESIQVYAQAAAVMTEGTTGDVICYPTINGTTKQVSFWQTSDYTEKQ